ncbi:unnamed protein product, partial [Prorocentrum cordatum]
RSAAASALSSPLGPRAPPSAAPGSGVPRACPGMSAAEGLAVGLSLWVGGAGLAACKLAAYVATGSPLVRASMFDSLGDVFSSVIMQITQRKIADTRDARRYPLGKHRFESLGVLFFCAFMTATMTNMIIDSLQTLLSPPEDAGPGAGDALRRLLEENPRLRWGYLPWSRPSVDALVAQYGGGEEEESEQSLATVLMVACVLVKLLCFAYCKAVAQRTQSGVVAALADDHRNDAVSNPGPRNRFGEVVRLPSPLLLRSPPLCSPPPRPPTSALARPCSHCHARALLRGLLSPHVFSQP